MSKFIASVLSAAVVASSIVLTPTIARAETYQQCLDYAAQVHQDNIAAGMPRSQADFIWSAMVRQCNKRFGK